MWARWLAPGGLRGQAATAMEDFEMFARKALFSSIGRAAVMATVAAVALTAVEPSLARAGSAAAGNGVSATAATSDATDFSARRRHYRGGGHLGQGRGAIGKTEILRDAVLEIVAVERFRWFAGEIGVPDKACDMRG